MGIVRLEGVTKKFGDVIAVDHVSIDVKRNEFFSLLGPSGCGKTTTLRMIAGFINPTEGSVYIEEEKVNNIPPYKRKTNMVFQNYALFPHMTVHDNVAFGLKMKKVDKKEITRLVKNALEIVRLSGYEKRYPKQLSGGEQQRVALARAIVTNPSVLLLDEPLSNLDAKLRQQMRRELKEIQKKIGITAIYVTHDQAEALSMSDRIVVLNQGRVEQIGTSTEIYQNPSSNFVANFIGQLNTFKGKILSIRHPEVKILTDCGLELYIPHEKELSENSPITVGIRPERINITKNQSLSLKNSFIGKIEYVSFLGSDIQYICSINDHKITVVTQNKRERPIYKQGEEVYIEWDTAECIILGARKG